MNANEMMIGDWVLINDLYWQVSAIFDDGYVKLKIWSEKQNQELEYLCKIDLVRPIPLTEEILKANGFKHQLSMNNVDHGWNLGYLWLTKDIELFIYKVHVKLSFVHELHHALRLCGLTELADNFKI